MVGKQNGLRAPVFLSLSPPLYLFSRALCPCLFPLYVQCPVINGTFEVPFALSLSPLSALSLSLSLSLSLFPSQRSIHCHRSRSSKFTKIALFSLTLIRFRILSVVVTQTVKTSQSAINCPNVQVSTKLY